MNEFDRMEQDPAPEQRQGKKKKLLLAVCLVAVLLAVGLAALRAWVHVPDLPDQGELPGSSQGDGSQPGHQGGRRKGVYTFLVVGKDTGGGGNTDTMLLLTYDTGEKTVRGLNLPRDTMVNVSTRSKRLNAVYNYNKGTDQANQAEQGMAALKEQVANLTGILPDFYVMVEWEAIGQLVDALGGVMFEVPFDMDYDDPYQDLHIHQKAGLRLLSGQDAMEVIRHRKNNDGSHSNGDVGRLKVQQDFLKATMATCLQPSTFLKLPALVDIFVENVTTDLTVGNIIAFAELARGMDPETGVSFATAPIAASFTYNRAALITLDGAGVLEIVNGGMNPYTEDILPEDLELLVRQKDGSFRVTSGQLADPNMGAAPAPKPAPEQPPAPGPEEPPEEDPVQGEEPEILPEEPPVEGETDLPPVEQEPGEEPPEPPEEGSEPPAELPPPIQPEDIFPEVEPPVSQDIPGA